LKSIYDVLIANEAPEKTIIRTPLKGLDIIPGNWQLANFEKESNTLNGKEFRLQDAVEKIKNNYDYIVIDCPASLGLLTINSLVAAKEVIVPLQCEFFALEGIVRLIEFIDNAKKEFNSNLTFKGIVLTMYSDTRLAKQVVSEINNSFPDVVFKSVIPKNISLAEASSLGKSILLHDPYSAGAIAYSNLTMEIISTDKKSEIKEYRPLSIKFRDFWPSNSIPRHALKKKYIPRHSSLK
jgi:chromosome partitioning protein